VCLQPDAHGAGDADADDVVLLWRMEDVFERDFHAWGNGDAGAHDRLLEGAASLGEACRRLAESRRGGLIVSDAPTPIGYGLDHADPGELANLIELQQAVNARFDAALGDAQVERLRVGALQHAHGTLATFDRRNWLMYRQPFSDRFAFAVGSAIADVVKARTDVPPKVLVLDCDGTLWGGVIVDDGIGALECSDAFPGFAYRSFQFAVQRLRNKGVLLALASKNDAEQVVEAFASVDGMVLTDADIAGRRVSWSPKPDGIAELADEFNLGLDAFVFVDDSDYELGAVNTQLPAVRTLRVPDEIEALPDLLAESGLFRAMRVTDDDRERTARMMQESSRRTASTAMSHDEFLAQLGLRVHVIDVGTRELGRVTQLINKTNQFNLTTLRRSESEVAALITDPDAQVLAFAVDDRFGEYGIVGVTISRWTGRNWELDTGLMSCRVLGRGVESAILASTVERARSTRPGEFLGRYRPTDRNAMVADLLTEHGFEPTGEAFVLPAAAEITVPAHITVVTS
jgi:FkbH-like protein